MPHRLLTALGRAARAVGRPEQWLSENRRSLLALAFALLAVPTSAAISRELEEPLASFDSTLLVLVIYLTAWATVTTWAHASAPASSVAAWARHEGRGTFYQRYVAGTAPGPGLSIAVGALALGTGVVWLPRGDELGSSLDAGPRLVLGIAVVAVSWFTMSISFAAAYRAEDLVAAAPVFRFPDAAEPVWTDYLFLSTSVSTSFGTNDVVVTSPAGRRTMTVHAVVAFVYNTVILSAVVSAVAAV